MWANMWNFGDKLYKIVHNEVYMVKNDPDSIGLQFGNFRASSNRQQ